MADKDMEPIEDTLALTESFEAWVSVDPDGDRIYHLDTGSVTLHFLKEEWDELRELFRTLEKGKK